MTQTLQIGQSAEVGSADLTHLLDNAIEDFSWTSPEGEQIWAPYVLNGHPCLPNPVSDTLRRPGAGKVMSTDFRAAASYAYNQLDPSDADQHTTTADAVRRLLVDGSLPDDRYNYIGLDCSGLVTQALATGLRHIDIDLYTELRIPHDDVKAYISQIYVPDQYPFYEQVVGASRASNGLTVSHFTDLFKPGNNPARLVNVSRLVSYENCVQIYAEDIRPGDIARFRSSSGTSSHVALVIETGNHDTVHLAHSSRIDPLYDIGGVDYFELSRQRMHNHHQLFAGLGYLSLHRLRVLDNARP